MSEHVDSIVSEHVERVCVCVCLRPGALKTSTFAWQADPPSGSWIIAAFVLYAVCTLFFVALLCARMLPSCSNRWGFVLVATQVVLALLVQAQDSTRKRDCNTRTLDAPEPVSIRTPEMR